MSAAGGSAAGSSWPGSTCTLTVPAHADFVALLRASVRSAATVADLTLAEVEELQIATSEAAALLLPLTGGVGLVELVLDIGPGQVRVRVGVDRTLPGTVDRASLGWVMLTALCPVVDVDDAGEAPSIAFTHALTEPSRTAL